MLQVLQRCKSSSCSAHLPVHLLGLHRAYAWPLLVPHCLHDALRALLSPAGDVRDLVAVYKNPPYPIFYDVVYHSYALVPMLASPLYYASKFSSTVLTSFITGAQCCVRNSVTVQSCGCFQVNFCVSQETMIIACASAHAGQPAELCQQVYFNSAHLIHHRWARVVVG